MREDHEYQFRTPEIQHDTAMRVSLGGAEKITVLTMSTTNAMLGIGYSGWYLWGNLSARVPGP